MSGAGYEQFADGLVACGVCTSVVPDSPRCRQAHDAWHQVQATTGFGRGEAFRLATRVGAVVTALVYVSLIRWWLS